MAEKIVKEWNVEAPWGKIAVISWGNNAKPPILLVHGFMDTSATFIPLIEHLPDRYYYIALDLPGHGKSDPLPQGMHSNKLHMIAALRILVKHMDWKKFVFMAHSMGCFMGLFYNSIYPDDILKMIFIDPILPLADYYNVFYRQPNFFKKKYREYYDNYQQWNSGRPRLYTFEKAVGLVVRNRNLSEEQAETILSRSMVPMGIDTYKLSWEPRMKKYRNQHYLKKLCTR